MSDKAFLVLEPFGPDFSLPDVPRDYTYLSVVTSRYEQIQLIASRLAGKDWTTEMTQEGSGVAVLCYPPEPVETETELRDLLGDIKVQIGDLGYVDVEPDMDDLDFDEEGFGDDEETPCPMCNGDCDDADFGDEDLDDDDFGDEDLDCPLMPPEMAESLVGCTITQVHLVEDYRVVFDLDDGRKMVYDEESILGFHLVD